MWAQVEIPNICNFGIFFFENEWKTIILCTYEDTS